MNKDGNGRDWEPITFPVFCIYYLKKTQKNFRQLKGKNEYLNYSNGKTVVVMLQCYFRIYLFATHLHHIYCVFLNCTR